MAAVVAAPGGDDLLHVVHGAAVAHQPWMVLQPELLLAWAHAYAGHSSSAAPSCYCSHLGLCQAMQTSRIVHHSA